jgi:hypothetical protein
MRVQQLLDVLVEEEHGVREASGLYVVGEERELDTPPHHRRASAAALGIRGQGLGLGFTV